MNPTPPRVTDERALVAALQLVETGQDTGGEGYATVRRMYTAARAEIVSLRAEIAAARFGDVVSREAAVAVAERFHGDVDAPTHWRQAAGRIAGALRALPPAKEAK